MFIEKFGLFKYSWDTEKGLLYNSFYWFVGLVSIYFFKNSVIFLYIFWVLILLVYLILWLVKRLNYVYFTKKLIVIFAVTIDYDDKKLKKIYNGLIENFREKLKDYNLSRDVKIEIKPVDIKFSDHSAAEAKTQINMPCTTLIISGLPITSNKEIEFKFNFHYEFRYYNNKKKEKFYKEFFNQKINKTFIGKDWKVKDNVNSKKKLYNDFFNVCTSTLAYCIATVGKFSQAKKLLQPIRDDCNKNKYKKEYAPLILDLRSVLFSINIIEFNLKYWDLKLEELKAIANELEKLEPYSYNTYMTRAIVCELENNREAAKNYTQEAENSHPKNIYDYKFNYLYFYLNEGDYNKAIEILNEIKKYIKQPFIGYIRNFLDYKYNKIKSLELLFNIGSVDFLFGDKKLGKKELKKFIKKAMNKNKYKMLIREAKFLIK